MLHILRYYSLIAAFLTDFVLSLCVSAFIYARAQLLQEISE